MRFIFLLCFIIPYFSFAQDDNKIDSLSYPCYSNGTSITMFFDSDTSSENKQLENYKAYLLAYPSYDTLKTDSTNKKILYVPTHGTFVEGNSKEDSLLRAEKEVTNPFLKSKFLLIQPELDSTEDSLLQRQGILFTKDNEPVLTDSQPATLSLTQEQKTRYTLETQANRCNYHNWEKHIKTYENKKNYVLICFNTDDWEIKSDFSVFFYEEMLKGKHSNKNELIEKTFIRWKAKYPTVEYKMASF
ncbi:hypothetical protein WAF17_09690 [Bernardetia sp. ABR2-2B]|uniref:hypothetical protein n=1 Tax=Bernardetia sp. ABR2-2B TaxID=3127472 RepID=UPI0030CEB5CF